MIITNSRYALVGYLITSYPTRDHGIIVIYFTRQGVHIKLLSLSSSLSLSLSDNDDSGAIVVVLVVVVVVVVVVIAIAIAIVIVFVILTFHKPCNKRIYVLLLEPFLLFWEPLPS